MRLLLALFQEAFERGPMAAIRLAGSWLAHVGFASLAVPVGCAVVCAVTISAFLLAVALDAVLGLPAAIWPLVPAGFVAGLVLAFVAMVRLYRAMPRVVRRTIEMPDDPPPERPATSQPMSPADLLAIDARLAPSPTEPDGPSATPRTPPPSSG